MDEDMLCVMDLLDLEEELIDVHLKSIMSKKYLTNKCLVSVIHLLQYKLLLNVKEGTECENDEEYEFLVKLIKLANVNNIDYTCKIISLVLNLNTTSVVAKSEYLVQQILQNIENSTEKCNGDVDITVVPNNLLVFKMYDSILDALIKNDRKITLIFYDLPLENILRDSETNVKMHFLMNTVPKLFQAVVGYNIIDKIWDYLKNIDDQSKGNPLEILCCLASFYLPAPDSDGNYMYRSEIVYDIEFWNIILNGIKCGNNLNRKLSIYLAKRALDYLPLLKTDVVVKSKKDIIFEWKNNDAEKLKAKWNNFFILLESLEEKQSNIILPTLQIFDCICDMNYHWLQCVFLLGLNHDNYQVKMKCVEKRLKIFISTKEEVLMLLNALNDFNIFIDENILDVKLKLMDIIKVNSILLEMIPEIKWSPVPLYHISSILSSLNANELISCNRDIIQTIKKLFNIPCNNNIIKKSVQINFAYFTINCISGLNSCTEYATLYSNIPSNILELVMDTVCVHLENKLHISVEEKPLFWNYLSNAYDKIPFTLIYVTYHINDINAFEKIVGEKILNINNNICRQYAGKSECINDLIYLTQLFYRIKDMPGFESIKFKIMKESNNLLMYILQLFSNDIDISLDEMILLFEGYQQILEETISTTDVMEKALHLYKTSILFLKDKTCNLNKKLMSLFTLDILSNNKCLRKCYKQEIISLKNVLEISQRVYQEHHSYKGNGRLLSKFNEKACEIIYYLIDEDFLTTENYLNATLSYIEHVLDCGGIGCLLWVLKIINKIITNLLSCDNIKFDLPQFIDRIWMEIDELKFNSQYAICMEEFVILLTQDSILTRQIYNNTVLAYCTKILDQGYTKVTPIYCLIKTLSNKNISDYGHTLFVLCDILLYSPVLKKEQRINELYELEIMNDPKYKISRSNCIIPITYEITYLAVLTLSRINHTETLNTLKLLLRDKINVLFKNKVRYHGGSQVHKKLLLAIQHLLFISIVAPKTNDSKNILDWTVEMLGKLPHQPNVRTCLEWFIALNVYMKKMNLQQILNYLLNNNVPILSQFMITYWITKNKILNGIITNEEYELQMDTLLAHSMGATFNIRLHSQYLSLILYKLKNEKSIKYINTMIIIENTLKNNADEKNLIRVQEDYFINDFDIINNLRPSFIYYALSNYCEQSYLQYNFNCIKNLIDLINVNLYENIKNDTIKQTFSANSECDESLLNINLHRNNNTQNDDECLNSDLASVVQKKYIPRKNMCDVEEICKLNKKITNGSELIVVASLVDKLPNLGGIARTCEVFGVKTYVLDNLQHVKDKQFQALSVSAERWLNIEEIGPGRPLKTYLMKKKEEGYSIVGAEQTSTSCSLQSFRFPKKTILLLGHEKEGIPCDLLPMMDSCVEVPQQGLIRSLNVHVTAAIFIWEYSRQNIL